MREELLQIIEKNSRINIEDLAKMLGKDEIDVANEIKKLEEDGTICGYHTLINWEKTSIEKVSALIEVKVTPLRGQGFDKMAERIYNRWLSFSIRKGAVNKGNRGKGYIYRKH